MHENAPHRILIVLGTRPEAIKLARVVHACRDRKELAPRVVLTGQHADLVLPVLEYFQIVPDQTLQVMQPGQSVVSLLAKCLGQLDEEIAASQPRAILAQGDTISAQGAAMASFLRKIPLVHVEAGLRTGNLHAPWPEEYSRRIITLSASLHCAPTAQAEENLLREGIDPSRIKRTGNTIVDALLWTIEKERARAISDREQFPFPPDRHVVLVTLHRREHHGAILDQQCQGIMTLAAKFREIEFVCPIHPHPEVSSALRRHFAEQPNIRLIAPPHYPEFVRLMDRASLILTDSGGIQEEAPTLGKLVLIMRQATERPEAIASGFARLVGVTKEQIVAESEVLLCAITKVPVGHVTAPTGANPFGDGHASQRIADLVVRLLEAG